MSVDELVDYITNLPRLVTEYDSVYYNKYSASNNEYNALTKYENTEKFLEYKKEREEARLGNKLFSKEYKQKLRDIREKYSTEIKNMKNYNKIIMNYTMKWQQC